MAFLSGSLSFQRYRVLSPEVRAFGIEHIEKLSEYAAGDLEVSVDNPVIAGFLGGDHLFDRSFDLEKNVLLDALHFGIRVDSHAIPSAIRKAWLQMETANLLASSPGRRPNKSQREAIKEAVEQRAREESAGGKYVRTNQFPVLWDAPTGMIYFGGPSGAAGDKFVQLVGDAFQMELDRASAGYLATRWAESQGLVDKLDNLRPTMFHPEHSEGQAGWVNNESPHPDFLGNEFLYWLWFSVEQDSDTFQLTDGTEVTVMFSRSLGMECPNGLSGKANFTSEIPTRLPEAMEGIRSGKMPRKAGLTLVRLGQQYELTIQAESLAISGAKLTKDPDAEGRQVLESRIDAIRQLNETIDRLYELFVSTRVSPAWAEQAERISRWASPLHPDRKRKVA